MARIRKRPVSFGNPALACYHGYVYTLEHQQQQQIGPGDLRKRPLMEGAADATRMVAMVDVPPEQVPEGILNLARSHRPWIEHVRIVIAESDEPKQQQEVQLLYPLSSVALSPGTSAMENAASILAAEHDYSTEARLLRSDCAFDNNDNKPTRKYMVLLELSSEQAASLFVEDLHLQPYTSLDEAQVCHVHHVIAVQGQDGVSLMSPFFAPATNSSAQRGLEILPSSSSVESSASDNTAATGAHSEDYNCAVCLEHLELDVGTNGDARSSILTTVCNHSFHIECLLQWQDSPCPVCRYDHAGLNEALSQCHSCGTTENNYVCLICGVVSCGGSARASAGASSSRRSTNVKDEFVDEGHVVVVDASQQLMSGSHARKHYDETLHAYALDTETQHVWDFAGQGYVHRLLQNKDDGKLVEVSDPNNTTSEERSLNPGLTQAQEGEIVHRKLEGFASQYYTLLKSQLEQQRIYYEGRLQEIRREYDNSQSRTKRKTADLVLALKQERHQLSHRLTSLKSRCQKVKEDVSFLRHMNESLEANKAPLKRQVAEALQDRMETRQMFQNLLSPLQEKVIRLMLQLENESQLEQASQLGDTNEERKPAAWN
jgi:BRCA1-associated protein